MLISLLPVRIQGFLDSDPSGFFTFIGAGSVSLIVVGLYVVARMGVVS